jgi:RNA polymerase sigma factor (TIGR02999 family)
MAVLTARDFELLLPWYLNGTLADPERSLVAAYLKAHPEEEARVRWNASLREAIEEQADEIPEDLGLQRAVSAVGGGAADPQAQPEDRERARYPREGGGEITRLLQGVHAGDVAVRNELFALAYEELKKLAHVRLYQGGRNNLLDTTALVHETYIRFIQSSQLHSKDRRSFFAFASQVMRSVIVDTARARLAQRRGGGAAELTLSTQLLDHLPSGEEAILEVDEALLVLEQAEPRLARLVEMRYYGGYSEAEIAETLGVTERTVQRDWGKSRLLLKAALQRR